MLNIIIDSHMFKKPKSNLKSKNYEKLCSQMLRQMDIKKLSFKAAEYLALWVETLRKCLANVESLELIWILNQRHSLYSTLVKQMTKSHNYRGICQ